MWYAPSVSTWVTERAHAPWAFARQPMLELGRAHRARYLAATPWPHVVIDDVLGEDRSLAIARAFPAPNDASWKRREYAEQAGRLAHRNALEDAEPALRTLLVELTQQPFLELLNALVGRRDLIADPSYTGAGPLVTVRGGHLAVHVDFNRDSARKLDRVVTALYYAPLDWNDAWGGELELWDRARTQCEVRIAPRRDRLVLIGYGEDHWHGHPSPLACPEGSSRAVVMAHYYAAREQAGDADQAHGAIWASQP